MSDGMDMIGTGIGLGIMGLGAGVFIKSMSNAASSINGKKRSTKRKKSSRKK